MTLRVYLGFATPQKKHSPSMQGRGSRFKHRLSLATAGAGQRAAVGGENERELPTPVLAPDHVLYPIA